MMSKSIWHHGKKNGDKNLIMVTKTSAPVEITIPTKVEEIQTIHDALAYILDGHNLQRISGFKGPDEKYHRWSFSDCCGIMVREYFFDNENDVIKWAISMLGWSLINKIVKTVGLNSWQIKSMSEYDRKGAIYGIANYDTERWSMKSVNLFLDTI